MSDDGKFYLNNSNISGIEYIAIFNVQQTEQWTFPFNGDVYDYYFLGTVTGSASSPELFTFKPTKIDLSYFDYDKMYSINFPTLNNVIYDIDTGGEYGYGFYSKVDFSGVNNIAINHLVMKDDIHGTGNAPANLIAEFGIMAVEKGSSEEVILSQILSKLSQMESSINNSIGNAAGNIVDSVGNAADSITDSIENQYKVEENEDFGVGDIQEQVNQKLGVLNFGADTLNNFLGLFSPSNAGDTSITFPGFSITVQGVKYQVWNDKQFDLSFLDQHFGVLMTAVRTITVLSVWLAVLQYLVKAKDQLINNRG